MADTLIEGNYAKGMLVILGAGASYDCVEGGDQSLAPPLTNQLAKSSPYTGEIVAKYEQAQPVIGALRHALRGNLNPSSSVQAKSLEQALLDFRDSAGDNSTMRSQLTAFRFYLRDLIYEAALRARKQNDGVNNYTRLIQETVRWSRRTGEIVCFINFNFDPLLEWAYRAEMAFQFQPEVLSDYIKGPRVFILKPHGSVLWSWEDDRLPIENWDMPHVEVISAGEPTAEENLRLRATSEPSNMFFDNETGLAYGSYPAMALPMAGVKSFVWPPEQQQLFRDGFQNGVFGKILTIGWRGNEEHFLQLLPSRIGNTASLWTVTSDEPGDSEEVARNLSAIVRSTTACYPVTSGFSGFINSDIFDNFLAL